jgi:hypothetical protein
MEVGGVFAALESIAMPLQPPLDYEPVRPKPAPFWRRNVLLWAIICFNGYAFAVIGPWFVVAGIHSFFVDPNGSLRMFGEPVQTVPQKILWTLLNLLIGALGVWFVAWHRFSKRSGDVSQPANAVDRSRE